MWSKGESSMSDYIGVKNLCSLCKHGELKNRDKYGELNPKKVVCQNEKSDFFNIATVGLLCAPCFRQKELRESTKVEYVGFGD